jgi:hypothetical protein
LTSAFGQKADILVKDGFNEIQCGRHALVADELIDQR